MLIKKVLHPFYIFQVFSVIIWIGEEYYTYALVILLMSMVSVAWEIYTAVRNQKQLENMTRVEVILPVLRDNILVHLDSRQLVIGDSIILSASNASLIGLQVPCDMVLVQGECVMDESSITGESIPVVKTALPVTGGDSSKIRDQNKSNVIFGGSTFQKLVEKPNWGRSQVEVDEGEMVIAIVVATGFATSKGIMTLCEASYFAQYFTLPRLSSSSTKTRISSWGCLAWSPGSHSLEGR
jgi:cation-transporting P-type ATPase 13A2